MVVKDFVVLSQNTCLIVFFLWFHQKSPENHTSAGETSTGRAPWRWVDVKFFSPKNRRVNSLVCKGANNNARPQNPQTPSLHLKVLRVKDEFLFFRPYPEAHLQICLGSTSKFG